MKKSDLTKNKILLVAEEEFSRVGLHGARVDRIAQNAEVNKRMIYEYFSSKENLYANVLRTVYARLSEFEQAIQVNKKSGIEAVCLIIEKYFEFLQDNPSFVSLVMWENLNKAEYIEQSEAELVKQPGLAAMRYVIEKGVESGEFYADTDIDQTLISLNLFCFSCFSNRYTQEKVFKLTAPQKDSAKTRINHICKVFTKLLCK